jgi:membrane protein implicated in regulation of membrane protease activity
MRIAKPLLLVMTPIGVAWGLLEAARFHWWLAVLMAALLTVVSLLVWSVVRRIRAERPPP